jgi:glutamate dehydrogenase/leucine dehydrogenase
MNIKDYNCSGYERVVRCTDEASGLDAIIAVHNTKLGPAMGGTRFAGYDSEESQLEDVLRLSKGMTYKNSLCGNDLGGGKAVINKNLIKDKKAAFKVYADFVNSLNGLYITAGDVGTTQEDLVYISQFTPYIGGFDLDSSLPTAKTVFHGVRAALDFKNFEKRFTITVSGLGKVGSKLIDLAMLDPRFNGVVVSEISNDAYNAWKAKGIRHTRLDVNNVHTTGANVFSPCALGKVINSTTVDSIRSNIVCGAANNQLETDDIINNRKFVYLPDYLVNGGGVIAVAGKYAGMSDSEIDARLDLVYDKSFEILTEARATGKTTVEIANTLAEERFTKG